VNTPYSVFTLSFLPNKVVNAAQKDTQKHIFLSFCKIISLKRLHFNIFFVPLHRRQQIADGNIRSFLTR